MKDSWVWAFLQYGTLTMGVSLSFVVVADALNVVHEQLVYVALIGNFSPAAILWYRKTMTEYYAGDLREIGYALLAVLFWPLMVVVGLVAGLRAARSPAAAADEIDAQQR